MNEPAKQIQHRAWSLQKRAVVTLVGAFGVLVVGLLIGANIYFIGIRMGLFSSQSLKRLTLASLVEDAAFMEAIKKAQQSTVCLNEAYKIQLTYPNSVVDVATTSAQKCTVFAASAANKPVITIHLLAIERAALIEKLAKDLTGAMVDSFAHTMYPASSVRGNRQGLPYAGYILGISPNQSLLVEVLPSLGQFERAGVAIVQSIALR